VASVGEDLPASATSSISDRAPSKDAEGPASHEITARETGNAHDSLVTRLYHVLDRDSAIDASHLIRGGFLGQDPRQPRSVQVLDDHATLRCDRPTLGPVRFREGSLHTDRRDMATHDPPGNQVSHLAPLLHAGEVVGNDEFGDSDLLRLQLRDAIGERLLRIGIEEFLEVGPGGLEPYDLDPRSPITDGPESNRDPVEDYGGGALCEGGREQRPADILHRQGEITLLEADFPSRLSDTACKGHTEARCTPEKCNPKSFATHRYLSPTRR
jgi:hypothetical protein